jgi:hypothetical protein
VELDLVLELEALMVEVAVFVLALGLGLVLGYWAAIPRVRVLERELAQAQQVSARVSAQVWELPQVRAKAQE